MTFHAALIGATDGTEGWDTVSAVFNTIERLGRDVLVEYRDEIEDLACRLIDAVDIPRVPAMFERPIKMWLKLQVDWTLDRFVAPDND